MGNTQKDMIHTIKHMQSQYKISLHDVQIATWKNHAINLHQEKPLNSY